MGYQKPVPYTRATSWAAHKRRNPPSSEPGIDMFCPIGTPVLAAEAGRVADTGDSIQPATGRFVTIDLDDGRRVRYLHLSRRTVSIGARVGRGQLIGYSGATGYGEEDWSWNVAETGGAHVHMTLWPLHLYVFTTSGTLDPELYFDAGGFAGSDTKPFEEDEIVGAAQDLQASIDYWGKTLQAEIHDRRGVVIVWTSAEGADVPRTAWVVDHGAGTKRNIHRGIDTVENALKYMKWLNDQGIPTLDGDQPSAYLAGYRDISVG